MAIFELDMCLWNTDAPGGNKIQIWQNLKVPNFDPAQPPGAWDVSEVWETLGMNIQSKFDYCRTIQTLNIALCL